MKDYLTDGWSIYITVENSHKIIGFTVFNGIDLHMICFNMSAAVQ